MLSFTNNNWIQSPFFAPNESIRKTTVLNYSEIEKKLFHEPIENFTSYSNIPDEDKSFMEAHICAEWQISLKNSQGLKVAKRILLRSITCN